MPKTRRTHDDGGATTNKAAVEQPQVEAAEAEVEEVEEAPAPTVAELKERAEELGVELPPRAKKADIIEAIEEAEETEA